MSRAPTAPVLWCLLAAALFGASTPAAKVLLDGLGPFSLAGLLYLGAALGVLPFALRRPARRLVVDRRNGLLLTGAILFGGILGPLLLLSGLTLAPASSVALWLNLETPATVALGLLFFREHLDGRAWLAAGLVVGASVLVASPSGFGNAGAAVLILAACLAWGLDNNLTALIDGLTPAQSTLAKGLAAGAVNLGLGLFLEGTPGALPVVGLGLGVGALAYGASLVLYVSGAQQLGASRSQMIFATAPFWGLALAWTTLGEAITPVEALAGVMMVLALWLMHTERHAHEHTHAPQEHVHRHRHDDGHHDHVHPGLPAWLWHSHEHSHDDRLHSHPHTPDLHHRHDH
ncbi:MAG: DMT family transporter [Deltaproteobacteria bacterium]|nr:DMT family transporter [Deltaproteobacteria bacterium]